MPPVKAMSGLLLAMDLFVMLVETGALVIRLLEVGALVVRLFHFVTMMRLVFFAGIPGKSRSNSKGTENDRRHECQADIFHGYLQISRLIRARPRENQSPRA